MPVYPVLLDAPKHCAGAVQSHSALENTAQARSGATGRSKNTARASSGATVRSKQLFQQCSGAIVSSKQLLRRCCAATVEKHSKRLFEEPVLCATALCAHCTLFPPTPCMDMHGFTLVYNIPYASRNPAAQ